MTMQALVSDCSTHKNGGPQKGTTVQIRRNERNQDRKLRTFSAGRMPVRPLVPFVLTQQFHNIVVVLLRRDL
jgi:hypothetical protein